MEKITDNCLKSIKYLDKLYKISLNINKDKIEFKLFEEKNEMDYFFLEVNLKELQMMSKYFLMFETIEECGNNIKDIINSTEIQLETPTENIIQLKINLILTGKHSKELIFELSKKNLKQINY